MNIKSCLLFPVSCLLAFGAAHANWQYPGEYVGDGYYMDDGARFTVALRGGAAYGMGSIKNSVGSLVEQYIDTNDVFMGTADIGTLPVGKNLSGITFAAGAGLGVILPGAPKWRLEASWDHISKLDYNAAPLFDGNYTFAESGKTGIVSEAAAFSTVSTDVFGVMAYRDFFDDCCKPQGTFIPYIGFGIGYADSTTTLKMTDFAGHALTPTYGTVDAYNTITFYESKYSDGAPAGMLAAGFSYGLTDYTYLDLGARLTYVPKVKFMLANVDNTQYRDWYRADNLIYLNFMAGIRFEF